MHESELLKYLRGLHMDLQTVALEPEIRRLVGAERLAPALVLLGKYAQSLYPGTLSDRRELRPPASRYGILPQPSFSFSSQAIRPRVHFRVTKAPSSLTHKLAGILTSAVFEAQRGAQAGQAVL